MKLSKKTISIIGVLGSTAAIVTPIALGINSATKDNEYSNYNGSIVDHVTDLKRADDGKILPEVLDAYFDCGSKGKFQVTALKEWQDAILNSASPSDLKTIADKIDKQFLSVRKARGTNPKVVIRTKIMTISNDYFDIFGWKDSLDFFDWFLNNVSWGPDLLTLREFAIARGVNRNGSMITLGGHSGTRESTTITFYPDSFFGVQQIYDGSANSVLVDTSNLNLKANESVIRSYINPFIKTLHDNSKALFSPDFESNPTISNLILNKKTIEDYIEVYDDQTQVAISMSAAIEGSTGDKQTYVSDGNFASLASFLTYIHGEKEVVQRDVIKETDGTSRIVYPKRYLRRILSVMYGYTDTDRLEKQDTVRKALLSGSPTEFKDYKGDVENPTLKLEQLVDAPSDKKNILQKDGNDLTASSNFWGWDKKFLFSYNQLVQFDTGTKHTLESTVDNETISRSKPSILDAFTNFNAELPHDKAKEIGKIIKQNTRMSVERVVTSASKGYDGISKISLIFEKYQNLISTMRDYDAENNWAPVKFTNGHPDLHEFIPNLYLYKYQKREHGFLDYVIRSKDIFEPNEVATAEFLQQKLQPLIESGELDYDAEGFDINEKDHSKLTAIIDKIVTDGLGYGIDEPMIRKYFKYEAQTKTKIKEFGIEWLKYVSSHEYGHHQTLTYAKDLGSSNGLPESITEGVYNTDSDEITSGATQNGHNYEDTFSRIYENSYLRARSGVITDPTKPLDLKTAAQDIAMMQLNPHAAAKDPYYSFLLNNGLHNRFSADESEATKKDDDPTKHPVEKSIYSYTDFLNSWRAFKNPDELLEGLMIKPDELTKIRAKLDGESNIGYVAYLLNALDKSSYSLNPTLVAPEAPFADGTNRMIDPNTGNAEEASKISPRNLINGWNGGLGADNSVAEDVITLGSAFKTHVYKDGATDGLKYTDRLARVAGASGAFVEHEYPVPQAAVPTMTKKVRDLSGLDAAGFLALFATDQITLPGHGGVPYGQPSVLGSGATKIGTLSADIRLASDLFIEVDVDYSSGEPHYYLPGRAPKGMAVQSETVMATSTTFKTLPLVGLTRETPYTMVAAAFKLKNGKEFTDPTVSANDRQEFFMNFIVSEMNKSDSRKISADLPIKQLAAGKKSYSEWFTKGFGLEGISDSQNTIFKKSYGEYLFQTYYKNFGRFLGYTSDFTKDPDTVAPTAYLVTMLGTGKVTSNKLNDVYTAYISQGAYAFFGQMMSDYQVNLAETINRDMNQLIYAPSTTILQDGTSSEAFTGVNHSIPTIFTSVFNGDGSVSSISGMGTYDADTKILQTSTATSGYLEDAAIRRELDGMLYMVDEDQIEKYYRAIISKTPGHDIMTGPDGKEITKLVDMDGNPITKPDDWRKAFESYGHPLTRTGKAMVNFYAKSSGITQDKDLSGMYVNRYSGKAQFFGYLPEEDRDAGYDHIAITDETGKTSYIGLTWNYSNQFYNQRLAVEGPGAEGKKVGLGTGYFNEDGIWTTYAKGKEQIGWASDKFLADSFGNAILQPGHTYTLKFTKGTSLNGAHDMKLGTRDVLTAKTVASDPEEVYSLDHQDIEVMYNNGFDIYSGKFEMKLDQSVLKLRVRRDNDE